MRLNTTGIAARMMLSLDKKAIGEKLINGRQINPTICRSVTHKG